MTVGTPRHYAGVGNILPDSAAAEARLEVGDRIIDIDGQEVVWFSDLVRIVSANPGVPLKITVLRGKEELTLAATPKVQKRTDKDGNPIDIGLLGVRFDPEQAKYERQKDRKSVV